MIAALKFNNTFTYADKRKRGTLIKKYYTFWLPDRFVY